MSPTLAPNVRGVGTPRQKNCLQHGRLAYFDFTRAAQLCVGCGACTEVCPTGAIRLEDGGSMRRTIITGTVVCEQPLLAFIDPAAPLQTLAHRDYIRNRLPAHMAAHLDRDIIPSAARERGDRPTVLGLNGLAKR